jgi:hypothetical protein
MTNEELKEQAIDYQPTEIDGKPVNMPASLYTVGFYFYRQNEPPKDYFESLAFALAPEEEE